MAETVTKIRPKLGPRILESPRWSVGEQNFPDASAQRTVHEESITALFDSLLAGWRVHLLSGKNVQETCGSLPCISDADRFAVFRGVHPCFRGSVCSVPNKHDTI